MAKMMVTGVKRMVGRSKEGNDFDMCRAFVLVPVENGGSAKIQISGHGFEVGELELDPAGLPAFTGVKFPCELDLVMDQKFTRGEFRTVCIGVAVNADVKPVQRPAAVG